MTHYLFIGDVHSQAKPLSKALAYALKQNLVPVLLGDLWDSRNGKDESLTVMRLVLEFPDSLLLVQSNHQWSLLRFLESKKDTQSHDLTMGSLKGQEEFLLHWLSSLPLGYVLEDDNGVEYRAAHAYFPSNLEATSGVVYPGDVSSRVRGKMLYGPRFPGGERKVWWGSPSERGWVRVCGHYHEVFQGKESLVLDGSCGDPGGSLFGYNTREGGLVNFG